MRKLAWGVTGYVFIIFLATSVLNKPVSHHQSYILVICIVFCFGFSLNENNFQNAQKQVIKADFHGCYLSVAKSRCPSNIAISGIVLQETKNTFKLITQDNKIKSEYISKEN